MNPANAPQPAAPTPPPKKKKSKVLWFVIGGALLLVVLVIFAVIRGKGQNQGVIELLGDGEWRFGRVQGDEPVPV